MSLSDCPKCWETPCACGYEYQGWSLKRLEKLSTIIQTIIEEKRSGAQSSPFPY